jgi:salicylate synthetase
MTFEVRNIRRSARMVAKALIRAGAFDDYVLYEGPDSTRLVGGRRASVVVSNDQIVFEQDGVGRRAEAAADPFAQASRLLRQALGTDWVAFGYIAFDLARYYYPYKKCMPYPLLHLIVPVVDLEFERHRVSIHESGPYLKEIRRALRSDIAEASYEPFSFPVGGGDRVMYESGVRTLIDAIRTGHLQKAILSRRLQVSGSLDLLATHASGAGANGAARSYCFRLGSVGGVGFSPEILLSATVDGDVMTNPLAGTRPRGKSEAEDLDLRSQLHTDAKEVKEHAISVLLAQQEMSAVCEKGSVRVHDFMQVKAFRCVQHLSSRVSGRIAAGRTVWDALRVVFPGVTVSGIDKESAVAWIDHLETEPRGVYAGAVGWIDGRGAADMAIAIRSVYQYGDQVCLNAGAGIVAESVEEHEYVESVNKMNTMLSRVVLHTPHSGRMNVAS